MYVITIPNYPNNPEPYTILSKAYIHNKKPFAVADKHATQGSSVAVIFVPLFAQVTLQFSIVIVESKREKND